MSHKFRIWVALLIAPIGAMLLAFAFAFGGVVYAIMAPVMLAAAGLLLLGVHHHLPWRLVGAAACAGAVVFFVSGHYFELPARDRDRGIYVALMGIVGAYFAITGRFPRAALDHLARRRGIPCLPEGAPGDGSSHGNGQEQEKRFSPLEHRWLFLLVSGLWAIVLIGGGFLVWKVLTEIGRDAATPATSAPKEETLQLGVDFSSDGSLVATCGDRVRIFEVATGQLVQQIDGSTTRSIAFSPAVRELIAAGGDDGILRLWQVGKQETVREFPRHDGTLHSLAFDKSGRYLASGSVRLRAGKAELGQLRLWEVETGKAAQALDVKDAGIQGISFSADGKLIAFCRNPSAEACQVDVYRVGPWGLVVSLPLSAGKKLETTPFGKAVPIGMATRFAPGQQRLLVAGGICVRSDPSPYDFACQPNGLLWDADLNDPLSVKPLDDPRPGYYRALGLSPDGKRFATGAGDPFTEGHWPQVEMRETAQGKPVWRMPGAPHGIAISPDGKLVAFCQGYGGLRLLHADTGAVAAFMTGDN